MCEAHVAFRIQHAVQRHPPQLEQVDLLSVHPGYSMVRVWQTHEGNLFIDPVALEGICIVGPYGQDLCSPARELLVLISQARQLRATIRSHKPA